MIFKSSDSSLTIKIRSRCIEHWAAYRQRRLWHKERGGLLFATSVGSLCGNVEIIDVTGPSKKDRAGRTWLQLNYADMLRDISDQFASGRHFVGYWHTHPEPNPTLSSTDIFAFTDNLKAGGIRLERMVAVVIGDGNIADSVSAYLVDHERAERLNKEEYDCTERLDE